MRNVSILIICAVAILCTAESGRAENWPHWRGPDFDGSSPETDLPEEFGPEENLSWKTTLEGTGGSTPIVWGNRIFISSQDDRNRTWAVCRSAADGSVLWKHRVGSGFGNQQGNTAASPSAVTDGHRVWFLFGTGDLLCYDMRGKEIWSRNIQDRHGEWVYMWGFGSSPLLHDGKLYIPVLHGDHREKYTPETRSYLLCVDGETGKGLWKHVRQSDAPYEAKQAYTTPIPFEYEGQPQILVTGGDYVTAHSPADGRELWRSPSWNPEGIRTYRTICSAAVADDVVLISRSRGSGLRAVKPAQKDWEWAIDGDSPDVPTPLTYRGRFYVLSDESSKLRAVAPQSGDVLGQCTLGGNRSFHPSPTAADGKIYCMNNGGTVFVVSATQDPEILHRAKLGGEDTFASVAISGERLFIRTDDELFCFAKQGQ